MPIRCNLAVRLYNLCDSDRKGFIVRTDLSKLEGLIGEATASRLEGFFEFLDHNRVNVVHQQQFVDAIKPLLINIEKGFATNNNENEKCEQKPLIIGDEQKVCALASTQISTHHPINSTSPNTNDYFTFDEPNKKSTHVITPVTLQDELTVATMGQKVDNYPYTVVNKFDEVHPPSDRVVRSKPVSPQDQQFAEVIKRASASHMDLPRGVYDVKDMRKAGWEPSLAEELKAADHFPTHASQADLRTPDRIFKVVFVGDSAVGKTCFLHRFCHNRFKPLFNATIGVDFTVKTIRLKDRLVAVQLWDTAGQERFRSITKQYFRKADGVVLMYDVTSEQSFLNVRNWIESVRVGVDEGCVMCLVGNKVDLFANNASRQLTYEHGRKLAEEFGIMFFETSAATGYGIDQCMRSMAMKLQKREEDHLEEALKLEMSIQKTKRSWCCV
uniref:EF-hand domain-containing protein n=1 Tax=Steinernema glaseri TaxID=37863 RepID=A0A1I7ZND4_9BILA